MDFFIYMYEMLGYENTLTFFDTYFIIIDSLFCYNVSLGIIILFVSLISIVYTFYKVIRFFIREIEIYCMYIKVKYNL